MWVLFSLILALVGFDLAAMFWGVDSRESSQDPVWGRPQRVGPSLFPGAAGRRIGSRSRSSVSSHAR